MRRPTPIRLLIAAGAGLALVASSVVGQAAPQQTVTLTPLGTYETGLFDVAAAEIVKYDPGTQRLFVVNAEAAVVDVLDASNPNSPTKIGEIDATSLGAGANSVAVHDGLVAVAIEADPKTDPGLVAFYFADSLELLATVPAGALPDMVTFTPNGRRVLVANEGEPSENYTVDPVGSITVIDIPSTVSTLQQWKSVCDQFGSNHPVCQKSSHFALKGTTIGFEAFNGKEAALRESGVRISGPGASAAQDFEPEYIAVSKNSQEAYVSLQEANAFAVLDLRRLKVEKILPLGFKDHSLPGNGLDASDRDSAINIANWPIFGMYMPDAIETYQYRGKTYIVSANEGDTRDWGSYVDEDRVKDLTLDPTAFPDSATLRTDSNLGRLTVTNALGDTDNDGEFEELYVFGARSFSIWDEKGKLVFDSGDQLEQLIADINPDYFNSDHAENNFDNRSDNKGPEPEGVAIGEIRGKTYLFLGLERVGGIVIYDISNPNSPKFAGYFNNRDFSGDPEAGTALDLGPEGIEFIPAKVSPTGQPMLAVGNEVSGTTTLFSIDFLN